MVTQARIAASRISHTGWKLLGIFFLVVLYLNASKVEGAFFPVTKEWTITEAHEVAPGVTEFSGRAVKARDCAFEATSWYWPNTEDKRPVKVRFEAMGTSVNRGPGPYNFKEYRIWLPEKELRENAVGYVWHSCWDYLPWLTRTTFYKGSKLGPPQ